MDENITEMITPDAPQESPTEQIPVEEPNLTPEQETEEPVFVPQPPEVVPEEPQEIPAPPKAKKKLNKKILLAGIAAVAVIALVVVLVSLLGGGTKNTGVFIKDGELCLYVEGMKEPVELTSRLWKDAEGNGDFAGMGPYFTNYVCIHNNGQLVFFPDKYETRADGCTIFVKNVNKPKEDPVKIDSDITWYYVTEDGTQMLYAKYDDGTYSLHLYNVKTEEETRLAKDIRFSSHIAYSEDLSTICYLSDEDVYLWTPETEDVKVAKDVTVMRYLPEQDLLFAKTSDGELLMKTAEMEEAEEVADNVSTLLAAYPSGEAYYLRIVETERCLLDYLDDDMKAEDDAMSKPQKPNYPSAPQRVYYWNYATDEEYQAAKAQYDLDYAAYQEQYNTLKEAYNNALELYGLKEERDIIRETLKERVMEREEYVLYYFDGSEEHLLADSLVTNSFMDRASDVSVLVYNAYTPSDLVKPKLSEFDNKWDVVNAVQNALRDALYGSSEFYLVMGGKTTVIDQTAASNFMIQEDGSAVYFLDAPFVAYSDRNTAYADAPAAEAPAAEAPAETEPGEQEEDEGEVLIPADQREYASLYRISITDGQPGEAELVDSDVSLYFAPFIGKDASQLVYAKEVDEEDRSGAFYVAGQLISDEAYLYNYQFLEDKVLFFTDWDDEDSCGTLCMMKLGDEKAEITEIADDVHMVTITENNDLLYLQDYNLKRYEGTVFLYDMSKGKAKEIADDVNFLAYTK